MSLSRVSIFKSIDSSLGALACRVLGSINYMLDGKNDTASIDPKKIKNILIIRPGGMGDMILLLPVINTLRDSFPDASIKVVCEKRNMAVLNLAGMKDYAFVYDSNPITFLWKILNSEFDLVIDSEQFHHFSAVFAILSGAKTRIGFKINPRRNPLYTHLINYAPDGPEGEQFSRLLAPLPIETPEYKLEGILAEEPSIKAPYKDAPENGTYVAIHIGTSNIYKLWQTNKYAELTKGLQVAHQLTSVLIGDKKDACTSSQILNQNTDSELKTVSFAGKLDLSETCRIIKHARVFIGTDSGLAHLAIALGVPTIVMFGPSDDLKWGLQDNRHAIVKHNLPCSPCFIFGYHKPCKTIACMKNISVADLLDACAKVLTS